jgi:hypothetical protein
MTENIDHLPFELLAATQLDRRNAVYFDIEMAGPRWNIGIRWNLCQQ